MKEKGFEAEISTRSGANPGGTTICKMGFCHFQNMIFVAQILNVN